MAIPGLHTSNCSYILVAHNVSFAEPEYSEPLDQEVGERKKELKVVAASSLAQNNLARAL